MARQILLRSPKVNRKQPLLAETQTPTKATLLEDTLKTKPSRSKEKTSRIGEVAGGTAAECAAVCCCCPCTLMNLVMLAVYKIPSELLKKAARKKRKKKKKKQQGLLAGPTETMKGSTDGDDELVTGMGSGGVVDRGSGDAIEAVDMEKEMWDQFYSTGFWRSPSQREPPPL